MRCHQPELEIPGKGGFRDSDDKYLWNSQGVGSLASRMTPHPPELPRTCHHPTGPLLEPISSPLCCVFRARVPHLSPSPAHSHPYAFVHDFFFLLKPLSPLYRSEPFPKSPFACHLCYQKQCWRAPEVLLSSGIASVTRSLCSSPGKAVSALREV